jgi:iron-sulfur cluster assembly accessory protein
MSEEVMKQEKNTMAELSVSERAKTHLLKQLQKQPQMVGVRLSLSKTGCSGLSYVFQLIEAESELDRKISFDELTVYIENKSYPYLKGLEIDFVKESLNHKYVYNNPNQTGACGCGESFTIDDGFSS